MVNSPEILLPESTDEVAAILREGQPVQVAGNRTHDPFWVKSTAANDCAEIIPRQLSTRMLSGVVEHYADDQVVVVRAGTTLEELTRAIVPAGQCLPIVLALPGRPDATVGGLLSMNLPHLLDAQCGSWRDWILGMTVVRANGTIAKCGSLAVKNVAGYDVQKLFIGARGTLGVITEVIFKTYPVKARPHPALIEGRLDAGETYWIQRVFPTDFAAALEAARESLMFADRASSTLYCAPKSYVTLPRYLGDWVIRGGSGAKNLPIADPVQQRLMLRAKELFDPERLLNPGAMGIF